MPSFRSMANRTSLLVTSIKATNIFFLRLFRSHKKCLQKLRKIILNGRYIILEIDKFDEEMA